MSETRSVVVTELQDVALAMILLRRGAAEAALGAMQTRLGLGLPGPGRLESHGTLVLLWHGPDRLMALRSGGDGDLAAALAMVLDGVAHVVEASSARAVFCVAGAGAGAALGRWLPIDLHPHAFPPGSVALTLAGHVDVVVWREAERFCLACGSSFAGSLRGQLRELTRGAQA